MSDREILFRSLATVAARLGWSRRVPELGRLACALLALAAAAQVLRTLGLPAQVLTALAPLLPIGALGVVLLFAWRIGRETTLAQAAGVADARAGLRDELKSAYWFAQRVCHDAFVDALLTRAARSAQSIDVRQMIPLGVPRSALAALALAIFTAGLAWVAPRVALPHSQGPNAASPAAASARPAQRIFGDELEKMGEKEKAGTQTLLPEGALPGGQQPDWKQLDQVAMQLPAGAEEEALRRAIAARDARLVAKFLQALRHKQAAAAELDASRSGEPAAANSGPGNLERLQEAAEKDGNRAEEPPPGAFAEPTARVTQQLREDAEEERRKMTGRPAEGDVEFNPRMRAVSRNGVSMREVAFAAGEAAEAGAETSADGSAKGSPDGKSKAGGSSGEHPETELSGSLETQPVLGQPTVRLQVRLHQVRAERTEDPEQEATTEEFYAETRRRASQVGYESVEMQSRTQGEAALDPGRTPLSYREAVKRYFLNRHSKETEPAGHEEVQR